MTYPHDPDESNPVQEARSLFQPDDRNYELQTALEHFTMGVRAMQALVGPRKPSDVRERAPAFAHYPESRLEISVQHGVDLLDQQVGFSARAIIVQNINATGWIRFNDQLLFVPPRTQLALFNIPQGFEKFSIQWYSNQTTPGSVTPVAGQYATVWLFSEWVPPSIMTGTGTVIVDANGNAIFPAAAAKTDGMENTPVTEIGARNQVFNGVTWDRWRSDQPALSAGVNSHTMPSVGAAMMALYSPDGKFYAMQMSDLVDAINGGAFNAVDTLSAIIAYNGATWDRVRSSGDNADAVATGTLGRLFSLARNTVFNGVTWDRVRAASGTIGVTAVNHEGTKTTYTATVSALVIAAAATDFFTLIGSATKTVRVTRIGISGIATATADLDVRLIKKSAADTTGTLTNPAAIPHDSADAAGTAVVSAYTANPGALGAVVGTIRSFRQLVTTVAGAVASAPTVLDFSERNEKAIVLRGVAENIALNLNGATVAGLALNIEITWTEE